MTLCRWFLGLLLVLLAAGALAATANLTIVIAPPLIYPLTVSGGVLKTQGGAPFLMLGDTPQSIMGKLPVCTAGNTFALCQNSNDALPTQTMVAWFRDRQQHGFNTEQINLFCDTGLNCATDAPTLADGVTHPFTGTLSGCVTGNQTCYDLATPNSAYFAVVDAMLSIAAKFGQNVLLTTGNPNCGGAGFIPALVNNQAAAPSKVTGFGTFLGTRYNSTAFPNIVWQFGNDYQCYQTLADDTPAFAFMTALKAADPGHLQTLQASFNLSTSLDNATHNWAGLLSLTGAYTYYPPYDDIAHARTQSLTQPPFVIESNYEGEDNLGCNTPSTFRDRKTLWWTFIGGGQGYIYGSHYSWQFATGWNTASNIDTADVTQINYLYNFLNPLSWSTLVPDTGHTAVTAGFGTYGTAPFAYGTPGGSCASAGLNVADNTYVTAAKTPTGTLTLAYLPYTSTGAVTVNMSVVGTNPTAVWYDPTKDPALGSSYTAICSPSGSVCPTGSTSFAPGTQGLSTHADGASDWVLKITGTALAGGTATAYLSAVNLETPSLNSGLNTTIPNGGTATLTWDSTGAASCTSSDFTVTGGSAGIGSVTVSPTAAKTYTVNCGGAPASATVTVLGTRRNAAVTDCPSHGGGSGTTGSPWTGACIQAAVTAVAAGDTVFLAAGNWRLDLAAATISIAKSINLVGAASGNAFDAYGHPQNGYCSTNGSDACLPAGFTRIYQGGTGSTGYIQFEGCSNEYVGHIFVDGSPATAGGNLQGIMNFDNCTNVVVDDIHSWSFASGAAGICTVSCSGETQFSFNQCVNCTAKNSVFAPAPYLDNNGSGLYASAQTFQAQSEGNMLIQNNLFYMYYFNGFVIDDLTYTGNQMFMAFDARGGPNVLPSFGWGGSNPTSPWYSGSRTGTNPNCPYTTNGTQGNFCFYATNNLFNVTGAGQAFGVGGGINDPGTGGIVNLMHWTGNWVFGTTVAMDSCEWHIFNTTQGCTDSNTSLCGPPPNPTPCAFDGMQVNGFAITNNSLYGTTKVNLDFTGTGTLSNGHINQVTGAVAHQNYLSSPSNQYLTTSNSISPVASGNFGLDVSSGFTTPPTCSFTIGTLSGSTIPIASTSFTAQYGAVQYLTSTSSTTPTAGDSRWNQSGLNSGNDSYIPPVSFTPVTHGSTVYMWAMDSAPSPHISSCGSAAVP